MSLSQIGINSLQATNQWIGLINSNLQAASRTGYKTSRISFTDGLGINSVSNNLTLPPSTLNVQATSIEWGQGTIVNSEAKTHFAIQGEGFFVLHNPLSGKYYLSRDGEFHWAENGYLVNSAGLYVVSSGQDYVRMGKGDPSDIFSPDGYSAELLRHGDKSFLLLDVLNRDNLRMSQYGSTVFELDGDITTRVKNDFAATTDGITFVYDDPIMIPVVDDPGFITVANPPLIPDTNFTINFGANGPLTLPLNAATSIDSIVAAINGVAGVSASYDPVRDFLIINNTVAPGADNSVTWTGTNGPAMAKFFRMINDGGTVDELTTPGGDTNIVQSKRDIDNSDHADFKDIGFTGTAAPLHPAVPTSSSILSLVQPIPVYTHVKGTNVGITGPYVEAAAINGGASMILGESASSGEFDIVMNIRYADTLNDGSDTPIPGGLITFGFGQQDAHSFNSGGFEVVYNPSSAPVMLTSSVPPINLPAGGVVVRQRPVGYDPTSNAPQTGGPVQNVGSIAAAYTDILTNIAANGGVDHRIAIRLDGNQNLTFNVDGQTATFSLGGAGQELSGHLTLRNSLSVMQVHDMYMDLKRSANASTTGEMVPVNLHMTATVDQGEYKNRPRSRVVQSSLETSNASLTEYVPMLSLAQKVFSAISKIISTHNAVVDDINSLLR